MRRGGPKDDHWVSSLVMWEMLGEGKEKGEKRLSSYSEQNMTSLQRTECLTSALVSCLAGDFILFLWAKVFLEKGRDKMNYRGPCLQRKIEDT